MKVESYLTCYLITRTIFFDQRLFPSYLEEINFSFCLFLSGKCFSSLKTKYYNGKLQQHQSLNCWLIVCKVACLFVENTLHNISKGIKIKRHKSRTDAGQIFLQFLFLIISSNFVQCKICNALPYSFDLN